MIEFATIKDKKELSSLWQMTFLEDSAVIENFFRNVFPSVVTPVIRLDGEIASSLFLLPCRIGKFNGSCVYCAITKYSQRGKGYMKQLLDFSYDYCKEEKLDFLFLVPAEKSLFDYYAKCGFENFGISRICILNENEPLIKENLEFDYEIEFDNSVVEYWKNSCIVYGGEATDFGLVFDDEETVIRNAKGIYNQIPEKYKKSGVTVKGNINFGESYTPAMIKTENEEIKNIDKYIIDGEILTLNDRIYKKHKSAMNIYEMIANDLLKESKVD